VLASATVLGGCSSRLSMGDSSASVTEPLAAAPTGPVTASPLVQPTGRIRPPPVNMAGRWTLSSPGAGTCAMNFGGAPGAGEGTIAPEGGCPGNFFTSRKWVFEDAGLLIRDHTGQPLAQLAFAPPSRFDGQATTGRPVSLAR
jgi:Protease inhibitor Inh